MLPLAARAQPAGDPLAGQIVISLAASPQRPERAFAGTLNAARSGLVLRTDDYGRTWQDVTPSDLAGSEAAFSALAVDPSNPEIVWAADSVAGRLWRSDDGGDSWTPLSSVGGIVSAGSGIGAMTVEPRLEGSVLWIGTRLDGIWRSVDGGATWEAAGQGLGGPPAPTVRALVATPDGRLVAGTHAGVFLLPAPGAAWQQPAQPLPADAVVLTLALDAAEPDAVFYAGTSDQGVWRSDDGGQTWQPANGAGLPDNTYASFLASAGQNDGASTLLLGTNQSAFRSNDRGATWQAMTVAGQPWPAGCDAITSAGGVVYAGTRGQGIYTSFDAGQTWQSGAAVEPPAAGEPPAPPPSPTQVATPTPPPTSTPVPVATQPPPTELPATVEPTLAATPTPLTSSTPPPTPVATAQPTATPVLPSNAEPVAATGAEAPAGDARSPRWPLAVCLGSAGLLLAVIVVLGVSIYRDSPRRR